MTPRHALARHTGLRATGATYATTPSTHTFRATLDDNDKVEPRAFGVT